MGLLLTVKGADFSAAAIGFILPVMSGLEYFNFFGDAASKTARNLVVGKPGASVVGNPVVHAGYCTFQGLTNYVTTELADQSEVTLLAVARAPALAANTFGDVISSYNGTSPVAKVGTSILFNSNANPANSTLGDFHARTVSGTDTSFISVLPSGSLAADFNFYSGRMGATYNRIDDITHGLSGVGAVTSPRSAPNGQTYRVGSSAAGGGTGVTDIAWAAIYSRCLTDAEVASIYPKVQTYLATKGISV